LHTLAAKHKSTIRKILKITYPNLIIGNDSKYVKFLTNEELMKVRLDIKDKKWNSYTIVKDINWNLDDQSFQKYKKEK
jgi:hypothetical protein